MLGLFGGDLRRPFSTGKGVPRRPRNSQFCTFSPWEMVRWDAQSRKGLFIFCGAEAISVGAAARFSKLGRFPKTRFLRISKGGTPRRRREAKQGRRYGRERREREKSSAKRHDDEGTPRQDDARTDAQEEDSLEGLHTSAARLASEEEWGRQRPRGPFATCPGVP